MALELRQQLKLTQQLVMTPQLQQAIRLLQLSRLELVETVQQELLENPFLEETQDEAPQAEAPDQRATTTDAAADAAYDREISREADWEDYLGDFASTSRQSTVRESEMPEEMTSFEARYAAKPSLEGHLMWQLRLSSLTERQKDIGEVIIGNIASSGYLHATVDDIAEMAGVAPGEVDPVLHAVQRFDPVGVAARTAQECLLVQIEMLGYTRDRVQIGRASCRERE